MNTESKIKTLKIVCANGSQINIVKLSMKPKIITHRLNAITIKIPVTLIREIG